MKRRYFIVAAIFLFNPVISIIDILPDAIGYLLIFKALSEASYVYDNAYEAQMAFKRMSFVSIAKLLCLFILSSTDATMALVLSFTFSILEVIYGINAFLRLFEFLSHIALRCSEPSHSEKSDELKRFTIVFFMIRIVCSTLPDFFALFLTNPAKAWMYRFRTLMFFIFTVFALVVGIVWLVKAIKFFKGMLTASLSEKIKEDFKEQMKNRQSVFFSKDFIFSIGLISLSMIFSIDFYVDKIEILSDIILAPVIAIALIFLIKKGHVAFGKAERLIFSVLGTHFVASILNTVFYTRYNGEYLIESVIKNEKAQAMYLPVIIFTIIENIALIASVSLIFIFMKKQAIVKINENTKFFSEYSVEGYTKDFSAKINKKMIVSVVFLCIACVSSVVYVFVCPYNDSYVAVNTVLAVISLFPYVGTFSYINEEIYKKILKYS